MSKNNINDTQIGGDHYKGSTIQHWDLAASRDYDYFQGVITKYLDRWKHKNGTEDLKKALHYLQKYIEVVEQNAYNKRQAEIAKIYEQKETNNFGYCSQNNEYGTGEH